MIHEIGVQLAAALASKGAPFPVLDGPEMRPTTTFARERVVIEHDEDAGDTFVSRHRVDVNPRTVFSRKVGVKVTLYLKSPSRGATYWEHKRRAEQLLDMVLVQLRNIVVARQNIFELRSGRFVKPEDLQASETPGGAVYELLCTIDRGVADRNWDGSIGPQTFISPTTLNSPNLTFTAAGSTITRDAGSWITDGFAVSNILIVSGSVSNNGTTAAVVTVTDAVITLASGLVNEGPSSGITVTGNGVLPQTQTSVSEDGDTETV